MVIEKQQREGAARPESNGHYESTPLVLVVDDEPELASLLKEWLEDDGYRACSATDGEEAIGIFSRGGVNLVITDLVMPAMDGFVFDNPEWSTLIIGNGPPLSAGGQSRQMLNLRVWW